MKWCLLLISGSGSGVSGAKISRNLRQFVNWVLDNLIEM